MLQIEWSKIELKQDYNQYRNWGGAYWKTKNCDKLQTIQINFEKQKKKTQKTKNKTLWIHNKLWHTKTKTKTKSD